MPPFSNTRGNVARISRTKHNKATEQLKTNLVSAENRYSELQVQHQSIEDSLGAGLCSDDETRRLQQDLTKIKAEMSELSSHVKDSTTRAYSHDTTNGESRNEPTATSNPSNGIQDAAMQDASDEKGSSQQPNAGESGEPLHKSQERELALKASINSKSSSEEDNNGKQRIVDSLGVSWTMNIGAQYKSPFDGIERTVIGHIAKRPTTQYVHRLGDDSVNSALLNTYLPEGSSYDSAGGKRRDATLQSNRILENILRIQRSARRPIPQDVIQYLWIVCVYWDHKVDCGYAANVEVLHPDYNRRRPNTRCFIYLAPKYYQDFGLENKEGFSHETRATVKQFLRGTNDRQRSIALYDITVDRENKFEDRYMRGKENRPRRKLETLGDKDMRSISVQRSLNPQQASIQGNQSPQRTLRSSPKSTEARASLRSIKKEEEGDREEREDPPTNSSAEPRREVSDDAHIKEQFRQFIMDLYDKPASATYLDLPKEAQTLYPAQYLAYKSEYEKKIAVDNTR